MKQGLAQKQKLLEGWKIEPLSKVIEVFDSGSRPKGGVTHIKNGIPSISAEQMNNQGKFYFDNIKYIPEEFFKNLDKGIIHKYDTLIVKDGATTGKTCFIDDDFPFKKSAINEHVFVVRANEKIHPKLLFYNIFSDFGQKQIKKSFHGGTIGGITKSLLDDFFVVYPEDKKVQQQIVAKLDAQMAQIKIMKKEAEKEKGASEIFAESILKSVFNNPSYKKDKIKNLCVVNPRKSELKYSDDSETSFIPMESVDQYKGIIDMPQVKPFGKVKKGYTYFEENDVLFAKITPCMQNKKSAMAKNLINGFGFGTTEFHVLRANSKILPELLLYYVREGSFIEEAKSHFTGAVGQQRVPKEFIEEYEIYYPKSKEEQIRLLKTIENSNDEVHKINEMLDNKLSAISLLPSSLLNEVFGKYDIPDVK